MILVLLVVQQIASQFGTARKTSLVFFNIKQINHSILMNCILNIFKDFKNNTVLVIKTQNKYKLTLFRSIPSYTLNNIRKSFWALLLNQLYIVFVFVIVFGFLRNFNIFVYIIFSCYSFCKEIFSFIGAKIM